MKFNASNIALIFAGSLFASSAQAAVTFTSSAFDSAPISPQVMVVDFDNPNAPGYAFSYTTVTGADIYLGSDGLHSGVAAPPFGDLSHYLAVYGGGSATLTTPTLASLSLYIGSVDTYNTIAFYDGATAIASFTGTQLVASANGDQSSGGTNRRFNFDFGGAPVDKIVFSSSQNSFEFDNIAAAAVPEPGIWVMLLAGFGMLGLALRSRGLGADVFPA